MDQLTQPGSLLLFLAVAVGLAAVLVYGLWKKLNQPSELDEDQPEEDDRPETSEHSLADEDSGERKYCGKIEMALELNRLETADAEAIKLQGTKLEILFTVSAQSSVVAFQIPAETLECTFPEPLGRFLASLIHIQAGGRRIDYETLADQILDALKQKDAYELVTAMKNSRHDQIGRNLERAIDRRLRSKSVSVK